MGILSLFGSGKGKRHPESIALAIVGRYQQRRASGELRVDDRLFLELQQELTQKGAQKVFEDFRRRRARGFPKAELLLSMDIVVAISEAEHDAQTFKPIIAERKPTKEVADRMRPSADATYAKALAGQSITSADEDAVIFEEFLKEED
jgi:hypothetical protein